VSIKAIIRNQAGEILVVKEDADAWGLPGGGMDHADADVHACLAREFREELRIANEFTERFLRVETRYQTHRKRWKMFIVYEVEMIGELAFSVGEGVTDARFMSVAEYNKDKSMSEPAV
jgi:8-oxo-dGTP pyrophosphatase MutT (NUDIX family)